MIAYFIKNTHDMSHALKNLDTPQLKQQLEHMSGYQSYEFLASMTPQEPEKFVSQGDIEAKYRTHHFTEDERKRILKKLTAQQKQKLQIPID